MATILPLPYFGNIYFYHHFLRSEPILLEAHENYTKQSYRNRTEIATANGVLPLSIPVLKSNALKQAYTQVKIEYRTPWQKIHFKALESAYMHSPYFEFYIDEFMPFFSQQHEYLYQMNLQIHQLVLGMLKIETESVFTQDFFTPENSEHHILRDEISPKSEYWKSDAHFHPSAYFQVFREKHGFQPNLSILDLIFNEGPDACNILEKLINRNI